MLKRQLRTKRKSFHQENSWKPCFASFEEFCHSWMIFITYSIFCEKNKGCIGLNQTSNLETHIFLGFVFIKQNRESTEGYRTEKRSVRTFVKYIFISRFMYCMFQFLGSADNVLEQSLSCHQPNSNFSLRQQIFDEQLSQSKIYVCLSSPDWP